MTMRASFYYAALLLKEGAAYCVALCLSVCLSVRPVIVTASVTSRHLANYRYNDARAEGRISYGHLGRTSLFYMFLNNVVQVDNTHCSKEITSNCILVVICIFCTWYCAIAP